ncbi:hypothetical protein OEZ85_002670 [Tetradesmus obliquus]|uniref:START domain-containing protein n=1 Tax=Tetradesmus obliquus TaxID=3088 RepID=A0ABY8TYA3_TETOB|nr:hypothetical protein OEZ85_002670 [Tetradesmus obliquus]
MSGQVVLSESADLLADLALNGQGAKAAAVEVDTAEVEAAVLNASVLPSSEQQDATTSTALTWSSEQQPEAATAKAEQQLTPEQDAAAAECADNFVELYEQAFLSRAVQQLAAACSAAGIPESAVAAKLHTRGMNLQQLQARAAEVQNGIAECASDEGWRLVQDDGKLRLLYRHAAGSTVHCFKGSCLLPAPIYQPLSMAKEFDLVSSWNSYITNSSILRTYCDVDMLVYASVWLPWPFAERDVLISAVADDQLREKGVVAISFASPRDADAPPGDELPAGADKRVHIHFMPGSCMTMVPVAAAAPAAAAPAAPAAVIVAADGSTVQAAGAGAVAGAGDGEQQQTQVCVVANIETESHVPEAIISFVLKVFAPFFYSTVLKVLASAFKPGDPLPQRIAGHHELYDMIMKRCADFLAGHPDYA